MKYEITQNSEIANKLDRAHEISDGFYAFAEQAKHAIDCSVYYVEEEAFYVVEEYEFAHEEHDAPEAYNFSDIENVKFDEYKRTVHVAYSTREEMLEHIARFIAEKNHF